MNTDVLEPAILDKGMPASFGQSSNVHGCFCKGLGVEQRTAFQRLECYFQLQSGLWIQSSSRIGRHVEEGHIESTDILLQKVSAFGMNL